MSYTLRFTHDDGRVADYEFSAHYFIPTSAAGPVFSGELANGKSFQHPAPSTVRTVEQDGVVIYKRG